MPIAAPPLLKPTRDIECVALLTPGSALARHWQFTRTTFGIYEYAKAFDRHDLRFGDGSWQVLISAQLGDLVLLEHYGTELGRHAVRRLEGSA